MNIYIGNLSYDVNEDELRKRFAVFGQVESVSVVIDRRTGKSRGFGFVEMPNDTNAQKAIDELNNSDFEGKTITVNMARPKTERNDGGYNRRRY